MNKLLLFTIFTGILIFPSLTYADGPYLNIPPTNAFDKVRTDNGTVSAVNFSMPINIKGGASISVQSNNSTHTITITNTASPSTHQGTYNTTLANNVIKDNAGFKINFINGTNSPVNLVDDSVRKQINITIGVPSGAGGVSSITGTAHNVTASSSTGAVTLNTGDNVVVTGGSAQTISKEITHTQYVLMKGQNITFANSGVSASIAVNESLDNFGSATLLMHPSGILPARWTMLPGPGATGNIITLNRVNDIKNYEVLLLGSDVIGSNEFSLASYNGGTGTLRPFNFYMLNTKLFSMDTANTITDYVQHILTPIADVTGANSFWKSSTTADVLKYRDAAAGTTYSVVSTISATNATRGQLSGNGTGTTSASMVMDGVYATITPKNTGRITVSVTGVLANSVSGDGCNIGIRQGTSNMGANGVAVAGSLLGDNLRYTTAAAAQAVPFSRVYDFSGTVGTQYFFDLSQSRITGGTCTITSVDWNLVEH